ncbi:MAG TPA: type II 3-dehydroquinate dehydratase [Gammaproteobacteria bacterium]|jgi:3-dehydroquinate dehydratase-2|nr:type II 3-dehydroquinate dehydratase [Gammaproteobacteria bacterium]
MPRILLLQGANMNWLGIREPEIYGTTTAAELDQQILKYAQQKGFEVEIYYTNLEGEAINKLYEAYDQGFDAIVMNPGGFTFSGYALRDAIRGVRDRMVYVEVHIANHYARYRPGEHQNATAAAAVGVIMGFGLHGYFLGLDAALRLIETK